MKKDYKLYNMIFPPFLIIGLTIPYLITSIVGNFIIDSAVLLLISLIVYKRLDRGFYIKKVFLVYIFGFAADFLGLIYLFAASCICQDLCFSGRIQQGTFARNVLEGVYSVMDYTGEATVYTYLALISGIVLTSAVIFILNYFVVFKKKEMTGKQRLAAALMIAILTAPYTLLLRGTVFML